MRAAAFLTGLNSGLTLQRDIKQRAEDAENRRLDREALSAHPAQPAGADSSFTLDGASVDAPSLIRQFEGFRERPYWDVNANRVGYGSDTVTRADGTVQRVTPDMTVSREDAERDLARRTGEFSRRARSQVGASIWDAMPATATAPLTSIAYNYGSLPSSILAEARSGDPQALAAAVDGLSGDNDGTNRKRRAREAGIIRRAPAWGALARHIPSAS